MRDVSFGGLKAGRAGTRKESAAGAVAMGPNRASVVSTDAPEERNGGGSKTGAAADGVWAWITCDFCSPAGFR